MSDLSHFNHLIGQWSYLSVPAAVLIASLLGSSHCVSMCGPIAITIHNRRYNLILYHLGRLLSYLSLGTMAGYFGGALLSSNYQVISIASAIMISMLLLVSGYRLIRQESLDLPLSKKLTSVLFIPARWASRKSPVIRSVAIGIVNGFLPCGWLYVFVLGSIATKDALYGALLLGIFWLGTVPALSLFAVFYKKFLNTLPRRLNQIAGIILVVVGIANMMLLIMNLFVPTVHSAHL